MRGKTTTMLNEAIRLARQGRAVYIVAVPNQRSGLNFRIKELSCGKTADDLGIKWLGIQDPCIDWHRMRMYGAHPNCVLLADHYAVECKVADMLGSHVLAVLKGEAVYGHAPKEETMPGEAIWPKSNDVNKIRMSFNPRPTDESDLPFGGNSKED